MSLGESTSLGIWAGSTTAGMQPLPGFSTSLPTTRIRLCFTGQIRALRRLSAPRQVRSKGEGISFPLSHHHHTLHSTRAAKTPLFQEVTSMAKSRPALSLSSGCTPLCHLHNRCAIRVSVYCLILGSKIW